DGVDRNQLAVLGVPDGKNRARIRIERAEYAEGRRRDARAGRSTAKESSRVLSRQIAELVAHLSREAKLVGWCRTGLPVFVSNDEAIAAVAGRDLNAQFVLCSFVLGVEAARLGLRSFLDIEAGEQFDHLRDG